MLTITTPAFAHEAEIPMRYTQEGENLSPELVFRAFLPMLAHWYYSPTIRTLQIRRHPNAFGCIGSS